MQVSSLFAKQHGLYLKNAALFHHPPFYISRDSDNPEHFQFPAQRRVLATSVLRHSQDSRSAE